MPTKPEPTRAETLEWVRQSIRLATDRAKMERSCWEAFWEEYLEGLSGHPKANAETNARSLQIYDFTVRAKHRERDYLMEVAHFETILKALNVHNWLDGK